MQKIAAREFRTRLVLAETDALILLAAGVLAAESTKLAAAAKAGDKDAIAKAAGDVGKLGCGGCHKTYRGDKPK